MNSSPPNEEPTSPSPTPANPPAKDPRKRLQELLAISDRDRTDAQWDELVELEIQMAPGNRADSGSTPGDHNRQSKPRSGSNQGSNKPRQHAQPRQPRQQAQAQTQQPAAAKPGGGQMHRRRKPAPK